MKSLVKNTALFGSAEFSLLFVSLIRNKYLAVTIGAEGFGLVNLLQAFFNYANLVAGAWLSTASLKYLSEYNSKGEKEKVKIIFNVSVYIIFILATIILVLLLVFFPYIKKLFLDRQILFWYYAFFAASFWATSITNILRIFLQSIMDIKNIVRIRIISQILNLVLVMLLIYIFRLLGLFINFALIAFLTGIMFYLSVKKQVKFEKIKFSWLKREEIKKLISFSIVDVFLGFVDQTAEYLKRILILKMLNIASLGLFAASQSIRKYLGIMTTSSLVHLKPQMSQALTNEKRNKALNDYFRLMLIVGIISSVIVVLFSNEIIKILYSKSFNDLGKVLFIFILAQFILNIQNGYMFTTVGMAKLKLHSIAILTSTPFIVIIPYYFLDNLNLIAIGLGAIVTSFIRIFIYGFFLRSRYKVQMNFSNMILFILGILLILISNYYLTGLKLIIKSLWSFTLFGIIYSFLKASEKKAIWNFVLSKISNKK